MRKLPQLLLNATRAGPHLRVPVRVGRSCTQSGVLGYAHSGRLLFACARSIVLDEAFRHGLHDLLHAPAFLRTASLTDGPAPVFSFGTSDTSQRVSLGEGRGAM